MPFPDLVSAGFTAGEDSSKFSIEPIDPSIQYETEGGVRITRPRNTRDPGDTIVTGFTYLTNADMERLRTFYKSVRGGSVAFVYTHPVSAVNMMVRFSKPPKASYTGMGANIRWDVPEIILIVDYVIPA